jgi:glucose/mannose transport system permease protein
VLLFVMVVKVFDAVVAMTQGGPGTASEVPAKFIMDYLFGRANIGLASAASIVLLRPCWRSSRRCTSTRRSRAALWEVS